MARVSICGTHKIYSASFKDFMASTNLKARALAYLSFTASSSVMAGASGPKPKWTRARHFISLCLTNMRSLLQKLRDKAGLGRNSEQLGPPVLGSAVRFQYGPFQFKIQVVKGMPYEIEATTNLKNWVSISRGTAA